MEKVVSAYQGDGPYVFVCYAHENSATVFREIAWLADSEINAWYDQGIGPGQEWSDELANAIQGCSKFLYFISHDSVQSEHCRRELNFAQEEGRDVVAIHLEQTEVPSGLRLSLNNRQAILKHQLSVEDYRQRLLQVLQPLKRGTLQTPHGPAGHSLRRKPLLAVIGSLALMVAIGAWWSTHQENDSRAGQAISDEGPVAAAADEGPGKTIAVLPFADMSPDGSQEYFGDGIAEELINELVRLDGLRVAGRTSSFSFKGTSESLDAIAGALNVGTILEGSVRKHGNRVRITAQLINAADGYHLWSETYDRDLADIFAIQEEIATSVSGALGVRLGVGGVNAFKGAGTRNIEAYEAYLQGLGTGVLEHDEAIRLFERAIELDPNYSAAWSLLGQRTGATQWNANPEEASEINERATALVLRAVELDPESAQSMSLLGTMYYISKDWIRSEATHLRALSMLSDRPNLDQFGNFMLRNGRSAAALKQWDKAEAVEPLGGLRTPLRVYAVLAQGRFADAKEALAWYPEHRRHYLGLLIALNEGDSDSIKSMIAALPPMATYKTALYSPVLAAFDSPDEVLSILRATYADKGTRWPSKLHDIALLAAYFGDPEFALQAIGEEVRHTTLRLFSVVVSGNGRSSQVAGIQDAGIRTQSGRVLACKCVG